MRINKFDIPNKCLNVLIIGKRCSGKTMLIKDLITKRELSTYLAINHLASEYENFTDNVYTEYDKNIIETFLNKNIPFKNCIVFDNCMYTPKWIKDNSVCNLFMKKNNVFMSMSYPMSITPIIKDTIDYIFVFRDSNMSNIKNIYKQYCNNLVSFEQYCKIFTEITLNDHTCLVINNFAKSDKDLFMWYKAEPVWKILASKKKALLDIIREELMQKTWHPSRMINCLEYDELKAFCELDTQV